MPYYIAEIRINEKNNSKHKRKQKKTKIYILAALALITLLLSVQSMFCSTVATACEPTLPSILNNLGFNNITLTDIETFPPGIYNITLYAEMTSCHDKDALSYYPVNTSEFHTIFNGSEGGNGFVIPPITKTFAINSQFGLSLLALGPYRYFTEHELNPDYPEHHAQVYINLDNPEMFLIGFENRFRGGDRDYNDMVVSLVRINCKGIASITRSYETPNYNQSVTITAEIIDKIVYVELLVLSYQIGSGSWTNVTMSLDDGFYVADIQAQPYNTTVNYKVYALYTDGSAFVSELFYYTVGDFVPPIISDVFQTPSLPNPNELVTISANVTEPPEASGVKNVTLWYTIDDGWAFTDMLEAGDVWKANIPKQNGGVDVEFFIKAFDNAGNNASTASSGYTVIIPNSPPVAQFIYFPHTVYTDEVVDFDASISYDPDGTIVSYLWDFGDGSSASGASVSHAYSDNGEYAVILTVIDNGSAVDNEAAIQVVKNRRPIAEITESKIVLEKGETLTYNASLSFDPDGTIVSYQWDFGDGNTATGVTVEHAYSQSGIYTVKLTVTDNDGATDTATTTKIVGNEPPTASFTKTAETVSLNQPITFNATQSSDPDGTIVSYQWDFGDGNTATGVTVDHSYTQEGTFLITLTVTDDEGATDIAHAVVVIINQKPVASFTSTSETAETDETITFDASESYDPDGYIVSYFWNFGDGTNASGALVSHAYPENGEYAVTLTVVDDEGAVDSKFAIQVVKNRLPVAEITESATEVDKGEVVTYNASLSYDPDGTIVNYKWDFGDGNTATGVTANHSYAQDGTYLVKLTVTDNDGEKASTNTIIVVTNKKPVASFTATPETAEIDEAITFDASASYDPDGTIVSYQWDFGDGNAATGIEVNHAYSQHGIYTVKLTVTDDDGATDTFTVTKIVGNNSPFAAFSKSAETAHLNEEITFNADESFDPDGTIVNYYWDFGDGNTANGIEVNHAYSEYGLYLVTLTVTDNGGVTDSAYAIIVVANREPVASFTASPETVETGESITFDASASYDPDGTTVNYKWDFGDGNTATGVTTNHAYAQDGTYLVTLTVTDSDEATESIYTIIVVVNREPVASFSASPETVETGDSISFDASESYDPDGTIVSYQWDFGDGNTATGIKVSHAYSEAGNYTVTLTVIDDDGEVATASSDSAVAVTVRAFPLAILSVIALGIASLTATLLYGLFMKRRKKKKT